jgi:putative transposase
MTKLKDKRVENLLDSLISDYKSPEDVIGENGLLKRLTKRVLERLLESELTEHLGYEKHSIGGTNSGNSRNGRSQKGLLTDQGKILLDVPRDRNGDFSPKIIEKGQRRFSGFDDKIISLYARGMTTRDIQAHLKEIYQVDVSPELISTVTDSIVEDVKEWQSQPVNAIYPIVYFDALVVKIKDEGHVRNKSVYLAIGINLEGIKEVLGLWIEQTEGAKFWLKVVTELKNRGLQEIFIACVDGLKGFPEAIESVYPQAEIQLCIVHMVRNSLKYVSWKERKEVASDLRAIYRSYTASEAELKLDEFEDKWNKRYPIISKSWRNNWDRITPFFAYPNEIRKIIYTTNAIESLNSTVRKVIKNRGSFPNDQAATKLIYLALKNISKKWTMPIQNWKPALNQFAIIFESRMVTDN